MSGEVEYLSATWDEDGSTPLEDMRKFLQRVHDEPLWPDQVFYPPPVPVKRLSLPAPPPGPPAESFWAKLRCSLTTIGKKQ